MLLWFSIKQWKSQKDMEWFKKMEIMIVKQELQNVLKLPRPRSVLINLSHTSRKRMMLLPIFSPDLIKTRLK